MVELTQLKLPSRNGKPCACTLREFFARVFAHRSMLTLPTKDETLTWDVIGVAPPDAPAPLATTSLHTILKRVHMVLALPEERFKKTGSFAQRLTLNERKPSRQQISWSVLLVQHSQAFTDHALEFLTKRRTEIVKCLKAQGAEIWDTQFVWGSVAEARGQAVGYAKNLGRAIQGREKHSVQATMQSMPGCGRFYTQHATLLLTCGGLVSRGQKMGLSNLHDTVVIGDGGHRLLRLLTEEHLGFSCELSPESLDKLALRERPLWRKAALATGLKEQQLPLCLQKTQGRTHRKHDWLLLPEAFGDLLCEAAKALRVLIKARGTKLKAKDSSGWPNAVPAKKRRLTPSLIQRDG